MKREPTEMELRLEEKLIALLAEGPGQEFFRECRGSAGRVIEFEGQIQLRDVIPALIREMYAPPAEIWDALAAHDKQWREMNSTFVWHAFIDAASLPAGTRVGPPPTYEIRTDHEGPVQLRSPPEGT